MQLIYRYIKFIHSVVPFTMGIIIISLRDYARRLFYSLAIAYALSLTWLAAVSIDIYIILFLGIVVVAFLLFFMMHISERNSGQELFNAADKGPQKIALSFVVVMLGASLDSGSGFVENFTSPGTAFLFLANSLVTIFVVFGLADSYHYRNRKEKNEFIAEVISLYVICNFIVGVVIQYLYQTGY